jgi:flagella basal body P-ring formation protein FlgA
MPVFNYAEPKKLVIPAQAGTHAREARSSWRFHALLLLFVVATFALTASFARAEPGGDGVFRVQGTRVAAGYRIDADALEEIVRNRLDAEGMPEPYGAELREGADGADVALSGGSYEARVADFSLNRESGRFEGEIVFRASDGAEEKTRISGRAEAMEFAPVLARDVAKGAVIAPEMLTRVALPSRRLRAGTLREEADAVGKTAVRTLKRGAALRESDVEAPLLVRRNATVEIEYVAPNVRIVAVGKALEDGTKGQIIRTESFAGGKTVRASVTGENKVRALAEGAGR